MSQSPSVCCLIQGAGSHCRIVSQTGMARRPRSYDLRSQDASDEFNAIHSAKAKKMLDDFVIGELSADATPPAGSPLVTSRPVHLQAYQKPTMLAACSVHRHSRGTGTLDCVTTCRACLDNKPCLIDGLCATVCRRGSYVCVWLQAQGKRTRTPTQLQMR